MTPAVSGGRRGWVTMFNGSRDGYQVPLALAEAGMLEALVTDWYSPLDRGWFGGLASRLPARVQGYLARRHAPGLPSSRVRSRRGEAVRQMLGIGSHETGDARLGAWAGRLAARRGAGLLAYSYYAHAAFSAYPAGSGPRVLFQVHPHPASLRRLFEEEMALAGGVVATLADEEEMTASPARFRQLSEEPGMAEHCFVASAFTRRTLVENGVDPARITVIPYGVDLERFQPPAAPPSGPLRVLFVGQMVQRKGLRYLLEAWKRAALPDAELVLAGRGRMDDELLARYPGLFRLERDAGPDRLRELYQESDICCVPSLAEGFGLVYLESLACGTPVIGTDNTGAADLVRDGREGFVVPIRDTDALVDRLRWCHANRDELAAMRVLARRRAEEHSWAAFRRTLVAGLEALDGDARAG